MIRPARGGSAIAAKMSVMLGPPISVFHHEDLSAARLVAARGGHRVSVCLPAQEGATVGAIVTTIVGDLVERHGLVDEALVVDDGSVDATAAVARRSPASVPEGGRCSSDFPSWRGTGSTSAW